MLTAFVELQGAIHEYAVSLEREALGTRIDDEE
jgi:hypothetical protein